MSAAACRTGMASVGGAVVVQLYQFRLQHRQPLENLLTQWHRISV